MFLGMGEYSIHIGSINIDIYIQSYSSYWDDIDKSAPKREDVVKMEHAFGYCGKTRSTEQFHRS